MKSEEAFNITLNSLDTFIKEAEECIKHDLGYPAMMLLYEVMQFMMRQKDDQDPSLPIASHSVHYVRRFIGHMENTDWFVSSEDKDQDSIAELTSDFFYFSTKVSKDQGNISNGLIVKTHNRISSDGNPRKLPKETYIIVLDELLESIVMEIDKFYSG